MSELAVRVEGLGKEYRLGGPRERYSTLRDRLNRLASAPFKALRGRRERSEQNPPFWALKDVSFEVPRGEVVGIIGRNGAGKSSLLKILSRITEPTEGEVDINGRVGSLLEVGTGFHPELTGRENVYLNGAILGMRRADIARKFDEIVAFAEVEKFIDTPVKHFSSGMYMRLAFAVAAHLEPEVLVVDEVLAVGDAQFQKKCLGKMSEVATEGRTVLFVSHNMHTVRALCTVGCLLHEGRVSLWGPVSECVETYLSNSFGASGGEFAARAKVCGAGCWVRRAVVRNREGGRVFVGDSLVLEVECSFGLPTRQPKLGFVLAAAAGESILNANNSYLPFDNPAASVRSGRFVCDLGTIPLVPGRYLLSLWLGDQTGDHEALRDCLSFEVHERDIWGRGQQPPRHAGHLYWPTRFEFHQGGEGADA